MFLFYLYGRVPKYKHQNLKKFWEVISPVEFCVGLFFFTWRDDQFCRRGFAFISYVHNTACGGCDANLQSK